MLRSLVVLVVRCVEWDFAEEVVELKDSAEVEKVPAMAEVLYSAILLLFRSCPARASSSLPFCKSESYIPDTGSWGLACKPENLGACTLQAGLLLVVSWRC